MFDITKLITEKGGEKLAIDNEGRIFIVRTFTKDTPIGEVLDYMRDTLLIVTGINKINILEYFPLSMVDTFDFFIDDWYEKDLEQRYGERAICPFCDVTIAELITELNKQNDFSPFNIIKIYRKLFETKCICKEGK